MTIILLAAVPFVVSAGVFIACCVAAGRADKLTDEDAVRRALYPND
jgi:fructose-specific phosphotransferase system IIC component